MLIHWIASPSDLTRGQNNYFITRRTCVHAYYYKIASLNDPCDDAITSPSCAMCQAIAPILSSTQDAKCTALFGSLAVSGDHEKRLFVRESVGSARSVYHMINLFCLTRSYRIIALTISPHSPCRLTHSNHSKLHTFAKSANKMYIIFKQ